MTFEAASDTCYRHSARQSWTLCQRCARTICHECQIPAAVGVQCPECVSEGRAAQEAAHRAHRQNVRAQEGGAVASGVRRWLGSPAPVTLAIIAVTALVGAVQIVTPMATAWLAFQENIAALQPWRLVTVALVHGGILHFAFNMLTLYLVGPTIEHRIGRWPFLGSYLTASAAGCVAVALLGSGAGVVGASGAVFGLFGVYIGLQRMLGGGFNPQVLIIVGINLAIGFIVPGVSWQAHVGGLAAGLALGFWIGQRMRRSQPHAARMPVGVTALAVVVLWGVALVA